MEKLIRGPDPAKPCYEKAPESIKIKYAAIKMCVFDCSAYRMIALPGVESRYRLKSR